jgi:hypothetical protein
MAKQVNFNEIERTARKTIESDGVVRLSVGVGLALFALFLLDHRHVWASYFGMNMPLWLPDPIRRRLTYPRIGYVRFPPLRSNRWKFFLTVMAFALGLAIAGLLDYSPLDWLAPVYLAALLAGIVLLWARKTGAPVDYAFAIICLASGIAGLWHTSRGADDGLVTAIQFWLLAGLATLIGLIQLTHFLRAHPMAAADHNPEVTRDVCEAQ